MAQAGGFCDESRGAAAVSGKNIPKILHTNRKRQSGSYQNTVETVVLLSRKDVYKRIKFDVNVEELMENLKRQT